MAALDAAIPVYGPQEDVDGRVKPIQDDVPLFPSENVMLWHFAFSANLAVVAPIFNPDVVEAKRQQQEWRAWGVRHFVVGTDKILFANTVHRYAAALGDATERG